jgi:CubicO group peptidase (beta-lactamase class C family)
MGGGETGGRVASPAVPRVYVPRLPLVPDPLRRIEVPRDLDEVTTLGEEAAPREGGMTRRAVEQIWDAVTRLYRSGVHPAISLCLRREGAVVLNRAIGHARGVGPGEPESAPRLLAAPETLFCIYSASKAVTAMVVHMLDERGELHIGDRVSDYIPGYAKHGKEAITIAHVLSHRAGVPNLPGEVLDPEKADDRELILGALCEARPARRPGKALAYHAVSGGFILGEIVERVTGRNIRAVLEDEILRPLGIEHCSYGVAPEDLGRVAHAYGTGLPVLPPLSMLLERALGVPVDRVIEVGNDPRFLTAVVPSGNVVTSAPELSRFFELLRRGGELDGVRVLEPRTIRRACTEHSYREIDFTLGFPTRYGLGVMLGAKVLSIYGPDTEEAFGHLGFTNMIGWADPQRALAGALLTSGKPILYPELPDLWSVMRRIGTQAPKVSPRP